MDNQIKEQGLNTQRIAIIVSAIIGIIAAFLPFQEVWRHSISLMESRDGSGYIIIVAFLISLIVALLGDRQKVMRKGHLAGAIIPGFIPGVLLALVALTYMSKDIDLLVNFEIGFYLVMIASASILITGLALKEEATSVSSTSKDAKVYCSECGKQYPSTAAGEYCDECGTKL
jgi:UDP-N-acetylmuramyl pentapeptide phosphotransferase/UDP-N-acetylglucosamine-1-phosphate transferase